jgi:NADH-quinone oxidoreductase subunit G
MIDLKGRIQRLNQAIQPPGSARDDWEVLRDLIQSTGGIERRLHHRGGLQAHGLREVPALRGLTISRVGDLGTQLSLNA